jgi:lysophospholipase L1-like esterase
MIFSKHQRVLFDGDSITDAGRDRNNFDSYGYGYVALVIEYLQTHHANLELQFLNRGVGGDTTRNVLKRFDRDIVAHQPDWVSMAIGVNDVWRFFDSAPNDAVLLEEFEANYRQLLEPLQGNTGLILVSPFLIEPDRQDPFRLRVDHYAAVVKHLALEFGAVFVPFQEAFDASSLAPSAFSDDRVHPNETGSQLMAQTFLRAIGA